MATVTKPLALDESINTTEQTPRNVADVLAQGLDAIEQAIAGGSGSGGHVIEDTNGTTLAQRADLQFVGVYTEDDSANDRTKVNVVRTMTKAQMDALSAAEKVGFIRTSDEADNPYQGKSTFSITAASGVSLTNVECFKSGEFTKVSGRVEFSSAVSQGSTVDVGTIPVEYAPIDTVFSFTVNGVLLGAIILSSTGSIKFRYVNGSGSWWETTFNIVY